MPRTGACCELGWGEPVEARVRSYCVVVDPPFFDDLSRLVEIGEQVLVEALVAETAIETLDEARWVGDDIASDPGTAPLHGGTRTDISGFRLARSSLTAPLS